MRITKVAAALMLAVTIGMHGGANLHAMGVESQRINGMSREDYPEGAKSVKKAVKEFEKLHNIKIMLPVKLPFDDTRSFGFIANDKLELEFSNERIRKVCKIYIWTIDNKPDQAMPYKTISLKDGTQAKLNENEQFCFLSFEKNNLYYNIGINKQNQTTDDLIAVAESLIK
ncbi:MULTISPECIES: hypothetical protein [unclassified Paenibacillus]|uniref:hypothetical protein n=1 Tax=unclassified Paenibacillus TaxID=185978 RepID=UPI001C105767|nr:MULTISPECIES: hypothetical protein [unclassified Paenibacillus]MBU5440567.1 hypothetical protein [Paenibacillus sp. MSJ-34]CAH0120032.1 hypothetical protein PAE9249_02545 [Paenibacillus sp. CECT 9249]